MPGIVFATEDLEDLRIQIGKWYFKSSSPTSKKDAETWNMLHCLSGMSVELSNLVKYTSGGSVVIDEALESISNLCIHSLDFMYRSSIPSQDALLSDMRPSNWEQKGIVSENSISIFCEGLAVFIGMLHRDVGRLADSDNVLPQIKNSLCHVWRLCCRLAVHIGSVDLNGLVKNGVEKITS